MKKYKYIAWSNGNNDFEFFRTEEEAQGFCDTEMEQEAGIASDEGWSDHVNGGIGYAKIVSQSKLETIDEKSNYMCVKDPKKEADCSYCDDGCHDGEEWPYNSDWDTVSDVVMEDVSNDSLIMAEQQLLGFFHGKSMNLDELVGAMGLCKEEWEMLKKDYNLSFMSEDDKEVIENIFKEGEDNAKEKSKSNCP